MLRENHKHKSKEEFIDFLLKSDLYKSENDPSFLKVKEAVYDNKMIYFENQDEFIKEVEYLLKNDVHINDENLEFRKIMHCVIKYHTHKNDFTISNNYYLNFKMVNRKLIIKTLKQYGIDHNFYEGVLYKIIPFPIFELDYILIVLCELFDNNYIRVKN